MTWDQPLGTRVRASTLIVALCMLLAYAPAMASADSWATVEAMPHPHVLGAATLLPNGQVLVTGGYTGGEISQVTQASDRYDPATGHWLDTAPFATATAAQGMSLLADGRVLMTGGYRSGYGVTNEVLGTALAFDPATNRWRSVADMPHLHGYHAQLTLPDGRVLVFGGYSSVADHDADGADDQVELYDPATNAWTIGATSPYYMANGTTTLLDDGSVLVAGGSSSNTNRNVAMKYTPATNRWTTRVGSFTDARRYQTATLLQNGKVLIAGGQGQDGRALRTASLYDPGTNSWSETVPMTTARFHATATLLPNGKVLVAGGYAGNGSYLTSAELYDPAANGWSPAASLATGRFYHTATLLADGRVLVASGYGASTQIDGSSTTLASAELYTPDGWPFPRGGGSGGGGGGGGSGGETPSISSLTLSARRFRAAGSGPSVTTARRRAPIGTTISYTDAAAATATFAVQRPAAGRTSNGHCVRPTGANRRHRRCTRWLTVGRFRHADTADTNSLHFSGRVNGHKLPTGRYRLSVKARVGRGTPSAAALASFRIVR